MSRARQRVRCNGRVQPALQLLDANADQAPSNLLDVGTS